MYLFFSPQDGFCYYSQPRWTCKVLEEDGGWRNRVCEAFSKSFRYWLNFFFPLDRNLVNLHRNIPNSAVILAYYDIFVYIHEPCSVAAVNNHVLLLFAAGVIESIAVSSEGALFCSVGDDKAMKVFDVVNFDMINMLRLGYVSSLHWWWLLKCNVYPWYITGNAECWFLQFSSRQVWVDLQSQRCHLHCGLLRKVHREDFCLWWKRKQPAIARLWQDALLPVVPNSPESSISSHRLCRQSRNARVLDRPAIRVQVPQERTLGIQNRHRLVWICQTQNLSNQSCIFSWWEENGHHCLWQESQNLPLPYRKTNEGVWWITYSKLPHIIDFYP